MVHELSSDYLPTLIGIKLDFPLCVKPTHTFLNYRKAECVAYSQAIEASFRYFNPSNFFSVNIALDEFNRAIDAASKASIPVGHVRGYSSALTPEIKTLLLQRKHLRSQLLTQDVAKRIRLLSADISTEVRDHAEFLLREVLDSNGFRTDPGRQWRLVHLPPNPRCTDTHDTNEAILRPNSSSIPSPQDQANFLVDHYASISRLPVSPEDRMIFHRLRQLEINRELPH